jgi:hypothetical protein
MSEKMRNGFVARSVARAHGLPLDDAETANRLYLEQMAAQLEASKTVARAVLLAMDGVHGPHGRLHQKRRRKSTSSGLSPSSRLGSSGSSAMPHFGQAPGRFYRTSGCIGQV